MNAFWGFAGRMLRDRVRITLALLCALVSASGLGAGLLAVYPILETIFEGSREGLPERAEAYNAGEPFVAVPQWVIERLPEGPFNAVVAIMVALGVVTVVGGVTNFLHAYLSLSVVYKAVTDIRRRLFSRVLRMPLGLAVSQGTSDAISRIVNDTTQLASGMTALLSRAVAQTLKGVAAFAAALILDWKLSIAAIFAGLVIAVVIRKLSTRIRRYTRRALERQADLYGAASEALQGLRVVKVHTNERHESARFHTINKAVMRHLLRARTARALMSPLNEVIALFSLGLLTILAARLIIIDNALDPSKMLLTLGALFIAAASLKPLTGIVNEIQTAAAAAERIKQLLDTEPEPGHDAGLPRLGRHKESVRFEGVGFTYPGSASPALVGIDLEVAHGTTVAVVGPNGSGKTTLLSLVPRLFDPTEGRVLVDGTDIATVGVRSLRRQIGVVTQETVLFGATIRENIAYGMSGATDDGVRAAARQARAAEFIESLPEGYETVVGERGSTLSGGQRQRIAIARAILRDPAILILDEATSMIDADSEARIGEALAEFSAGRTCLVVAHRLSTVKNADSIVVMDGGEVVDRGRHAELLERCEVYRLIANHQLVAAK